MTNADDFDGFNECWLRHETHLGKTIDYKNSIQDSLEIRKRYKTFFGETARSTPDQCKWTSDEYMQWTGERQVYNAMRMHLLSSEAKLAWLCRRKNAGNMR